MKDVAKLDNVYLNAHEKCLIASVVRQFYVVVSADQVESEQAACLRLHGLGQEDGRREECGEKYKVHHTRQSHVVRRSREAHKIDELSLLAD